MAAPSILQIMEGIEARLATISGLRVVEYVADQITPPQAVVGVPPISSYHTTMQRGRFTIDPTITVFTSASLDRVGQRALAEYANPTGEKSVIAAVEADQTLGGAAENVVVLSFEPLGLETVGVIGYYGGVFTLRVTARGN